MNIEQKIYSVIEQKNLKQSSLAASAGYDPKQFNALLRGRKIMKAKDIIPICKVLGITPNELLSFES